MSFWNFKNVSDDVVELRIEGDIVDDDQVWLYEWFDEACTSPNQFRQKLKECEGKELHVIVDTYGGSFFAGASIYSDLKARAGRTIGIVHSKAMSAGTTILMGCDEIRLSPTAILMIHDPMTRCYGDIAEFEKVLEVLHTIKDAIINAYEIKTGIARDDLSEMMAAETWFSAYEAVDKGFADLIIEEKGLIMQNAFSFSQMQIANSANHSAEQIKKYVTLKNEAIKERQKEEKLRELALYVECV